jgi:hypothetical protein
MSQNLNSQKSDVMDSIMGCMAMSMRRDAVRSLLAGNDTQAFTLEQYKNAYEKEWGPSRRFPEVRITDECAVMHLRSLGNLREVSPGVWAEDSQGGAEPQKDGG